MKPNGNEEKTERRERAARRKARRAGKTLTAETRPAMQRIVARWAKDAALVKEYDTVKLSDWEAFAQAFERLWAGAGYLAQEESAALNRIELAVRRAEPAFGCLREEVNENAEGIRKSVY